MATPVNLRTCLEGIVGLSPDLPGGSLSGYFLTDQKDGMPIKMVAATIDTQAGIAKILRDARADGVKNFLTDLSAEFSKEWKPIYEDHNGYVGKIEQSTAITYHRSRAVVEITSKGLPAVMSLRGFQMYQSVTATVTVDLYSDEDLTTPLATVDVDCVANRWTTATFASAVQIDLSDLYRSSDNHSRYFLTWEVPDGSYPRTNKFNCCGKKPHWQDFISAAGYSVEDISEMEKPVTAQSHGAFGMGISFDCSIAMTFGDFLCSYDYSNFNAEGFYWIMAKALQHGGVMCLADAFIKSQNINQYTVLSREVVYGIRAHAEKEYYIALSYLAANPPEGATGYYECRNARMSMRSILV